MKTKLKSKLKVKSAVSEKNSFEIANAEKQKTNLKSKKIYFSQLSSKYNLKSKIPNRFIQEHGFANSSFSFISLDNNSKNKRDSILDTNLFQSNLDFNPEYQSNSNLYLP